MKNKLINVCNRLRDDLKFENPSLQKVLEKDNQIDDQLSAFVSTLNEKQVEDFVQLRYDLDLIRRYARVASLKLSMEDPEDSLEHEIEKVKILTEESSNYDEAIVEIERQAHRHTGRISDVIKSFFMWKETPEEYAKKDS